MYSNPSKPSGHCMYYQFNIQQFHILPTQCIYVDLTTNSDYFSMQHCLTVFNNQDGECLLRGTVWLITFCIRIMSCLQAVPSLKQSVAGFSWQSGFDPVRMTLGVDTVSLGRVFLPVLWYYAVIVIPPMLHTHLHLHVAFTTRTNARSLKQYFFGNLRSTAKKSTFTFSCTKEVECLNVTNCCVYSGHQTLWELRQVAKQLSTPNTPAACSNNNLTCQNNQQIRTE